MDKAVFYYDLAVKLKKNERTEEIGELFCCMAECLSQQGW